jgi:hypothetical protein
MSEPGAMMIDAILKAQPSLAAQVRYTAGTGNTADLTGSVATALCTGLEHMRAQTDQGLYNGADGLVRYKASDEPAAWKADNALCGQVVEVLLYGETAWRRVRVMGRRAMAGAVRLKVVAEFDAK